MKKINKKVFFFSLIFLILLVTPVYAEEEVEVFKQWTNVNIRHVVEFNGSINTVSANITVKDPDNVLIVSFQAMQKNLASGDFNYTVPAGSNGKIGFYNYDICGYSTSTSGICESFEYQITPSGDNSLMGYYFMIIILSYGVLGFGIIKGDITISLLGSFALSLLGLWILHNGIDIFKNYLTDSFAIITLGLAAYVSAKAAHEYIEI